ncbi:MAG: cytochrome C, partial [Gammaproteobacteria bacterium]
MKQKMIWMLLVGGMLFPLQALLADDGGWFSFGKRRPDVAPVNNDLYDRECGACHFAYQPGL